MGTGFGKPGVKDSPHAQRFGIAASPSPGSASPNRPLPPGERAKRAPCSCPLPWRERAERVSVPGEGGAAGVGRPNGATALALLRQIDDRTGGAGFGWGQHPGLIRLRVGVFAGDWAWTVDDDGADRVAVGFVGVLVDTWNGWAVPVGVSLGIVAVMGAALLGMAIAEFQRTE